MDVSAPPRASESFVQGTSWAPVPGSELRRHIVRYLSGFLAVGVTVALMALQKARDLYVAVGVGAIVQVVIAAAVAWWSCRWAQSKVTLERRADGRLFLQGRRCRFAAREEAVQVLAIIPAGTRWLMPMVLLDLTQPVLLELSVPPPEPFRKAIELSADVRVTVRSPGFSLKRALLRLAPALGVGVWGLVVPRGYYDYYSVCLTAPFLLWIAVWGLFDFSGHWLLSMRPRGLSLGRHGPIGWELSPRLDDAGDALFIAWRGGERGFDTSPMRLPNGHAWFLFSTILERAREAGQRESELVSRPKPGAPTA